METLVLERKNRIYLASTAKVVRSEDDVASEIAAAVKWKIDKANPFLTWIAGDFVEADNPNRNTQFWTKDDLSANEHTIKYAPLNMVHKVRQPVGFFVDTRAVPIKKEEAADTQGTMKIQALSAMWSHIFPFEQVLVDSADESGQLFYSMECRGTHLICAGDKGCGEQFDYMAFDDHCDHLKERSSIRHIVNPTFRGGALIIPPIKPGWANANASIFQEAVMQEAARFAEQTEAQHASLQSNGYDISASAWEHLMAQIISLGLNQE